MHYGNTSLLASQLLFSLGILNTGFPLIACVMVIIYPNLIKSDRSDAQYLNFCLVAGVFRIVFWSCAPFGLRDHMTILFMNAFGISVYALMQNQFKRISNEYFKY